MTEPFYPLQFEPIYQYRLWGGRCLADWLPEPLPGDGPIGEAWLLSDRDDYPSRVAAGPLKGRSLVELMGGWRQQILGSRATQYKRFPLLLKFLDVREMLSVQVHPADNLTKLIPSGNTGKTEAWVVLEAGPRSRIYAGLKPGTTVSDLRALSQRTADDHLASFTPALGQTILINAGTVHALGDGVVVFEVQENSDVTFRLYDWDHVDPKTGHTRSLQVEEALQCIDFAQKPIGPVAPLVEATSPVVRERLVDCAHFRLWRYSGAESFPVGKPDEPRVVVCIEGSGNIEKDGAVYPVEKGAVVLLPAVVGTCHFWPKNLVTLLEAGLATAP